MEKYSKFFLTFIRAIELVNNQKGYSNVRLYIYNERKIDVKG